jgi:hypothetical protein
MMPRASADALDAHSVPDPLPSFTEEGSTARQLRQHIVEYYEAREEAKAADAMFELNPKFEGFLLKVQEKAVEMGTDVSKEFIEEVFQNCLLGDCPFDDSEQEPESTSAPAAH